MYSLYTRSTSRGPAIDINCRDEGRGGYSFYTRPFFSFPFLEKRISKNHQHHMVRHVSQHHQISSSPTSIYSILDILDMPMIII